MLIMFIIALPVLFVAQFLIPRAIGWIVTGRFHTEAHAEEGVKPEWIYEGR